MGGKDKNIGTEARQVGNLKKISDDKTDSLLNKKVSFEGMILLGINFADTLLTALLIRLGLAVELNPVMRLLLKHGIPTFITSKIAIVGTSVLALELLRTRRRHARLVRFSQWVAIVALLSAILLPNFLLLAYLVLRRLV